MDEICVYLGLVQTLNNEKQPVTTQSFHVVNAGDQLIRKISPPLIALAFIIALAGCSPTQEQSATPEQSRPNTADAIQETATAFIERINKELAQITIEAETAQWVRATYITKDTAVLAAKAQQRLLAYYSAAIEQSKRYDGQVLTDDIARSIELLKLRTSMPAPDDAGKRAELTEIVTRMQGQYGAGKYCPPGVENKDLCLDLQALSKILVESRDYDEQLEAWTGWRTISAQMRVDYQRFTELANEGARSLGYANLGVMWKSGYEMEVAEFEIESERLWQQVKPLYQALHCHVRSRLADHYGEDRVSRTGSIPAHLLGNMWAQEWGNIYDLVEPYPDRGTVNITQALKQQAFDAVKMTETAEDFFVSLGLPELPETFWERSMLTKPRDREVVCHASAWHLGSDDDVRIKQCIVASEEELATIHHELGHVYYYLAYKNLPTLYQSGAHDGFHEGIGDAISLSLTPAHLHKIGLAKRIEISDEAVINQQMRDAMDKIAFLPFGKLIDQWRWDVFAGNIPPEEYNSAWWKLRTRYQGIAPPVTRSESDFDPGAKYHIPGNTPYVRYFLARILQFQFHQALCSAAGHSGALHECSIYGSQQAGERLHAMLTIGASRPWQETLEQLTGNRKMDASALIEYFSPLLSWLDEQNRDRSCGW